MFAVKNGNMAEKNEGGAWTIRREAHKAQAKKEREGRRIASDENLTMAIGARQSLVA